MTPRRPGGHDSQRYEELISASLAGELDEHEERELRAHLADCADCATTMAAFGEQRQLVSGMRHVPLPRDMSARVRSGIESGRFAPRPWWRRPGGIAAAAATAGTALAAGVLAAVLLATPGEPPVAFDPSPTPHETAAPTPTDAGPVPTPTVEVTPTPTPVPGPTEPEPVMSAGSIGYLTLRGVMAELELHLVGYDPESGEQGQIAELDRPTGAPLAVSVSPDGEWLAYQLDGGGLGANEVRVADLLGGTTTSLGRTDGSAFAKRMAWSADGRYLAFTAADVERGTGPDVWIFDTETDERRQLTDTGRGYAASFDGDRLWVSVAGEVVNSYLVALDGDLSDIGESAAATLRGVFLPILSPDGERAIFWRGQMASFDPRWEFVGGGMLYVGGGTGSGPFASDQPVFPTLVIENREAFASAEVAWSGDGDWFSVWNAQWTGSPHGSPDAPFPDDRAIYVGRASTGDLIDAERALRLVGETGGIVDVTFVGHLFGDEVPALAVTIVEEFGGHAGESPGPQGGLLLTPASDSGGGMPLGDEAEWAGPAWLAPGD